MSIQLALDGHSFSVSGDAAAADGVVEVELLTASSLLVPAALCAEDDGARLLAAAGLPVGGGDAVVYGPATAGDDPQRVAMALPREAVGALADRLGTTPERVIAAGALRAEERAGLRFTSPLSHDAAGEGKRVWMFHAGELLYIKVYDGALRMAEVVPAPSIDDALCLVDRLEGVFGFAEYTLHMAGAAGAEWRKRMKRYFKRIVCE